MIREFQGKYRFLSNFYIEPDGTHVEGEFQAEKCSIEKEKGGFEGLSPWDAKRRGYKIQLRSDWEEIKDEVMYSLVLAKFSDHPNLLKKLLLTGDSQLVEGNSWHDRYWGICDGTGPKCGKGHPPDGKNMLGRILMMVREELSDA